MPTIDNYKKKRQLIAAAMMFCNVIVFFLWQRYKIVHPGNGFPYVPLLLYAVISVVSFYFIYKISNKDQRFAILVLPFTLAVLFIFQLLR